MAYPLSIVRFTLLKGERWQQLTHVVYTQSTGFSSDDQTIFIACSNVACWKLAIKQPKISCPNKNYVIFFWF